MKVKNSKVISVVVPLFNEEAVVLELVDRLRAVDGGLEDATLEVVAVDDGSTDATRVHLLEKLPLLACWKQVSLSRNFGLQAAYKAGLDHATGDAVVFMDGDLQDPPELIPEMLAEWRKGAKVVVACRNSRKETGMRRVCFDLFHKLFDKLTDGAIPPNSGTFGLMDRVVADHIRNLRERSLFYPALRCWAGYEKSEIFYDRDERLAGETKQSFRRLLNYAWDGVTNFSDVPLQMITTIGFFISGAAFLYGLFLVFQRIMQFFGCFQGLEVLGFTTIVVAVLFMGGIQMIAIGIIGTYLSRIFREVKDRPLYLVGGLSGSDCGDESRGGIHED